MAGFNDLPTELLVDNYEVMVDIVVQRDARAPGGTWLNRAPKYEYLVSGPGLSCEEIVRKARCLRVNVYIDSPAQQAEALAGLEDVIERFEGAREVCVVVVTDCEEVAEAWGEVEVESEGRQKAVEVLVLRPTELEGWRKKGGEVVGWGVGVLGDGVFRVLTL
ncbi:hypothetical protein LTR36_004886 [Oleoguttula mirabilis]|uniref:Uncharacterized protein n=1 Tax=Oleoguttula mirabilis TaxID=1507867 RepID=A0AAV9JG20_9PEZI|nr:hypothetical protein LTR36_004886 [Oleoguttula mirabilis]